MAAKKPAKKAKGLKKAKKLEAAKPLSSIHNMTVKKFD
jgi:hypothetical protein